MFNDSTQIKIKSYQQRSGQYSNIPDNDEIDLTEILNQIPEDYEEQQLMMHQHHLHAQHDHDHNHTIPSQNSPNNNANNNNQSNDNVIILAFKLVFALVFTQLQKLPISSRIIHQIMILHFIVSSLGLAQYVILCPQSIIDNYQYWRFITYIFAGIVIQYGYIHNLY